MNKKNSVFAAACLVAGNGIGSGVMAIPFFVQKAGIVGAVIAFLLSFTVTVLLHLMIAEVLLTVKSDSGDILEGFNLYLFRGRLKPVLTVLFFILLVTILMANLSAYISGTVEILDGLLPLPAIAVKLLFFAVCAVIVLMGLHTVGISEKITIVFMCFLLIPTIVLSLLNRNGSGISFTGVLDAFAAVFSMIMFSFSAVFAIPQAVELLEKDVVKIRKAIWLGIGLNFIMSASVAFCAVLSSKEVTRIAIIGWADSVGGGVRTAGSVFIVCAMLTSFWTTGLAASEMIRIRLKQSSFISFCIATLPALLLTFVVSSRFTNFLKVGGGAIAMVISVMIIPTFIICMKGRKPQVLTKSGASLPSVIFVLVMHILMAVGAFIDF